MFVLFYQGIPAAAKIVDLPNDKKEGEVTIKWNTPKDNGATITHYTVYQRTLNHGGTSQQWSEIRVITDVSVRKIAVKLIKGKTYEFVVTATNKYGESLKEKEKIARITVGGRFYHDYFYHYSFYFVSIYHFSIFSFFFKT